MKTKQEILQFIYSEYDYYGSYVKHLKNLISRLDILDIKYIVLSKTLVDLTIKFEELKKIIDFIERKEIK